MSRALPKNAMRTVLVTGAASGFGRGVVSALLARGFRVLATMRKADARRESFASEIAKYPDALEVLELDVTNAEDRDAIAQLATRRGLDGLVNNAGYGLFGALEDVSEAQLRAQLEVNFFGLALLTQALLPALRIARGFVINLSSTMGTTAFPLTGAYCASKFALEGLSEALYHELSPHGVRVHLVEPGGHRTDFATNVTWGDRVTAAYSGQTRGYRALYTRLASGSGTPPDAVIAAVAALAQRPSTRLRIPVGRDARAIATLRALLPDSITLPALSLIFRRVFPKNGPRPVTAIAPQSEAR